MCTELSRNKIKEYILGPFLACLKGSRKEGKKEERKKDRKKKTRTKGRTVESKNESMMARLLDESCFVVFRSTVQKNLVIVVVKV